MEHGDKPLAAPLISPESTTPPQAAAEPLVGKKISHYRVLQLLGRGGMGVVSKAAIAGVLLIAVSLGIVLERTWHRTTQQAVPPLIKTRRSVAVLDFRNLSGKPDQDWISTALGEMLSTELASGEQLRVIPDEDIAHMKLDLALPGAGSYGRDTLAKIRNNLSTDVVALGSYLDSGQSLRREPSY